MWTVLLGAALAHPITGTWTLAPTAQEATQVQTDAVHKALRSWPAFAVGLATPRLLEANVPCSRMELVVAEALVFSCDDKGRYERALSGDEGIVGPKGEPITSRVELKGDKLTLSWIGADGRRRDTYRVEGGVLTVESRLTAEALPRAITWRLTYRRE